MVQPRPVAQGDRSGGCRCQQPPWRPAPSKPAHPGGIDAHAGRRADKAAPELVAARIVAGIIAGEQLIWPDDASAGAGYLNDPRRLERLLAGRPTFASLSGIPPWDPATRSRCR